MRLLVIEDEVAMAAGLRSGLEADGFTVEVAVDGIGGLELAREGRFDVIVLDLMLPGLDGRAVCRELRAARIWTPILVLTARDEEQDEVAALDVGADDFLTKPFSYAVLLARLRSLLRRDSRDRPAALEVGDLYLDRAERRAWRGTVEVALTSRELALAAYLMTMAGEVVSKRQILDHVWGVDFEGDPNIVEVYVRHLRNKLDRPFGRDTIRTVRGVGYRIVVEAGVST